MTLTHNMNFKINKSLNFHVTGVIKIFLTLLTRNKKSLYFFFNDGGLSDTIQKLSLQKILLIFYINAPLIFSEQLYSNFIYKGIFTFFSTINFKYMYSLSTNISQIYMFCIFFILQLYIGYIYIIALVVFLYDGRNYFI